MQFGGTHQKSAQVALAKALALLATAEGGVTILGVYGSARGLSRLQSQGEYAARVRQRPVTDPSDATFRSAPGQSAPAQHQEKTSHAETRDQRGWP